MSMSISEDCACGAKFNATSSYADDVRREIAIWRKTHNRHGSQAMAARRTASVVEQADAEATP